MPSTPQLRIAITDRNPHVREFLCRELAQLGFAARPLTGDILAALEGREPPQVLVIDPETAVGRLPELARRLAGRAVVVLHVYEGEEAPDDFAGALVVEKQPHMGISRRRSWR